MTVLLLHDRQKVNLLNWILDDLYLRLDNWNVDDHFLLTRLVDINAGILMTVHLLHNRHMSHLL